jgi:hypothetical protein
MSEKKCKTPGCNRPVHARGMCDKCYRHQWRLENPGGNYQCTKNWRKQYPDKRNADRARYYEKHCHNTRNSGQSYDDFDDQMISDRVILNKSGEIIKTNVCDVSLAKHLGRSVEAIQVHRCGLKKALKKKTSVA